MAYMKKDKLYTFICPYTLSCDFKISGNWLDKLKEEYRKHSIEKHIITPIIQESKMI